MPNGFNLDATVSAYLDALASRCRNLLGNRIVGLYLHGSAVQGDYRPGKSDIDVLGVIDGPWPEEAKHVLAAKIGHAALPVPAPGLDLILVTEVVAAHPAQPPPYELWFSTGESWPTEIEVDGRSSEMLIHFSTCRAHGRALLGVEASDVFAPVEHTLMLRALIDVLEWHQSKVLDSFHDPLGQQSVLNACRAWRYAEERTLSSKSAGAEWLLALDPERELVRRALAIRRGEDERPLAAAAIQELLTEVLEVCRKRLD